MKADEIIYVPELKITFTGTDVYGLWRCAKMHYDGHCQAQAKEKGLIFGFLNQLSTNPDNPDLPAICEKTITVQLKFTDLDTLCKISEVSTYDPLVVPKDLWFGLSQAIKTLNDAYREINRVIRAEVALKP